MDDKLYMKMALSLALDAAAAGEVPVGAIIADDSGVIASAYNLRESTRDATAHAEMLAIRRACEALGRWRLSGCTLFVTLEPCPMCAGAVIQARLDRVVYAADDFRMGALGSLINLAAFEGSNHKTDIQAGLFADAAKAILKDFFAKRRGLGLAE